jgi:hypothetical protein
MNGGETVHRLEGLEPDSLLAFLALLGLLRALEAVREEWRPCAAWDLDRPPLRPILRLAKPVAPEAISEAAAEGVAELVSFHDFGAVTDLKLDRSEARSLCERSAGGGRYFADLCAALIGDAASGQDQSKIEPTPLAYPSVATSNFLKNFLALSKAVVPEKRYRDPSYPKDPAACIAQALFSPWKRLDRPVGLRWDPGEAKRHAYQWRAPTKEPPTTQHGANRLAIVGLSALTCAPVVGGNQVRLSVIGGDGSGDRFSFAWPIWKAPASLAAIRALLSHPGLREGDALGYLGVDHVRVSRRISLDRLRNFTAAEPVASRVAPGAAGRR